MPNILLQPGEEVRREGQVWVNNGNDPQVVIVPEAEPDDAIFWEHLARNAADDRPNLINANPPVIQDGGGGEWHDPNGAVLQAQDWYYVGTHDRVMVEAVNAVPEIRQEADLPPLDTPEQLRANALTSAIHKQYIKISPLSYLTNIEKVSFNQHYELRDSRRLSRDRQGDFLTMYNKFGHVQRVPICDTYTVPHFPISIGLNGLYDEAQWTIDGGQQLNNLFLQAFFDLIITAQPDVVETYDGPVGRAINKIRDTTRDYTISIVGKRAAIEYTKIHLISDKRSLLTAIGEEACARGVVGEYYGARLIEVPDDLYPYDNVLVIGRGASRLINFGNPTSLQATHDNGWNYEHAREIGMACFGINRIRKIEF
jgi:hypothetical protein